MPKSSRGGKTNNWLGNSTTQNTVPASATNFTNNPQSINGKVYRNSELNQGGATFKNNKKVALNLQGYTIEDLRKMDDDNLAEFLEAVANQDLPNFMVNNMMQRFVYALNMNDKPQVEDEATFLATTPQKERIYNAQKGFDVISEYDGTVAFHITGDDIQQELKYGKYTLIQNGYTSAGIYFSNERLGSAGYGHVQSVARLAKGANVTSYQQAERDLQAWGRYNPKSYAALQKLDSKNLKLKQGSNQSAYGDTKTTIFAALKGYDALTRDMGGREVYTAVINRGALIYSDKHYSTRKTPYNW